MAKARAIIRRRRAVQNTKKITQTMQLIASARYQKCLKRATASRPYTEKITEMIQLLAALKSADHRLLRPNEAGAASIMLVITSNRGLCGAYNASVLRAATEYRRRLLAGGVEPAIEMVGKKGVNYLRFLGFPMSQTITDVEHQIPFARVAEMAERYMRMYLADEVGRVDVAYMQFHSMGVQRPAVAQLLPIEPPKAEEEGRTRVRPEFEFSPSPEVLLGRLIPESVKIRLFQYFNDAIVSEQVARMVAMKAATDAAGDVIKYLTRRYSRARQSQITTELADIVGGANAVS